MLCMIIPSFQGWEWVISMLPKSLMDVECKVLMGWDLFKVWSFVCLCHTLFCHTMLKRMEVHEGGKKGRIRLVTSILGEVICRRNVGFGAKSQWILTCYVCRRCKEYIKKELERIENSPEARQWWRTPLIPVLGRQRQTDFWVQG